MSCGVYRAPLGFRWFLHGSPTLLGTLLAFYSVIPLNKNNIYLQLLLLFMSSDFEKDDKCREFCLYAVQSLNKPYVIISVGTNYDWKETHTGLVLGSDKVS